MSLNRLSLAGVVLAEGVPTTKESLPTGVAKTWYSLGAVFYGIMNIVFYVGIALTVVFLIIGGIRYITSGGSKEGSEAARGMITNAVIGFIVVLGAFALKTIVAKTLTGADITLPSWFTTVPTE